PKHGKHGANVLSRRGSFFRKTGCRSAGGFLSGQRKSAHGCRTILDTPVAARSPEPFTLKRAGQSDPIETGVPGPGPEPQRKKDPRDLGRRFQPCAFRGPDRAYVVPSDCEKSDSRLM